MKQIAKFFLQNKALSWLLLTLILLGGIYSYINMGKLEDAPFTIKQALVTTTYPGASALEVQQQVTDVLEESIQSLGELYYLKSDNRAGLSKITVYVKKEIRAKDMQQLWDKLRRKVNDVQSKLPAGAGPSVVNDDFGDVLGVFYGLSSESRTYRELEDQAKEIKNELLAVEDVARIELFGIQNRSIEVTVNPGMLSQTGVTLADIASAFEKQNKIVDAGGMETASLRLRIEAEGSFSSLQEIENLTVVSKDGGYFRLGEIADVCESYVHPARNLMKINGVPAVGIAISTVADGNVVDMAERVAQHVDALNERMPEGFRLTPIYDQGHESAVANDGFVLNLIVSVLTVVGVLLGFIGLKNGFLIGSGLIFSIFGTLIYMQATGIALQRMSLAAIIIAMGMLVDNAIVGVRCGPGQHAAGNAETGSHTFCRFVYSHAAAGSHINCRTGLPSSLSVTAHYRRVALYPLHCHCSLTAAELDSRHQSEYLLCTGVCKTSPPGGAEGRTFPGKILRPVPEGPENHHPEKIYDCRCHGSVAGMRRNGIQVHSPALYSPAEQAVFHHRHVASGRYPD